jgi:hypothetical protein
MAKEDNVFIKIQIEKNHVSKNFKLSVHFDENAPNFLSQANQMYWAPTSEEMKFLMDMYDIILKNNTGGKNSFASEKEIHDPFVDTAEHDSSERIQHVSQSNYRQKEKDDIFSEVETDYTTADVTNEEQLSESIKEKPMDEQIKQPSEDKEIFVQINDHAIDDIIQKKNHDAKQDILSYEEDKRSIDALLKKSKQKE